MNEFSLIEHYFKPIAVNRQDVLLGIGDDAACVHVPAKNNLLISTDTLVSGIHFLPEWDPYAIASRAILVNISDMAAMAAQPCWITLALTLPELNPPWLESFAKGLKDSLQRFNVALIGGDTTQGPLAITITVFGLAPEGRAVRRSGAKPGDIIFVSGALGAAALAVKFLQKPLPQQEREILMHQLMQPQPRVDLIPLIRNYATAAIDISDGLSADLNHICVASGVGATLNKQEIPVHSLVRQYLLEEAVDLALTGGDDYELCFTVPAASYDELMLELKRNHLVCYPVGVIEENKGLRIKAVDGVVDKLEPKGYSHF